MSSAFSLAVLNPGGRDPEQYFPRGAGEPGDPRAAHPPINYHAYAACVSGSFHSDTKAALATGWPVLLLLRRDLSPSWRALRRLKAAGRPVAVAFKEAGAMQVAERLTGAGELRLLQNIIAQADGCLAATPWLEAFFRAARPADAAAGTTAFIPTPYPVDDPRWDFSLPFAQRRGIFVGTREPGIPARQHVPALLAARRVGELSGEPVTVLNAEGWRGSRALAALGYRAGNEKLRVLPGPLPYPAYLREMARRRLVFQLDRSAVPGQVAGDALLCRLPCVGGDGAVERVAFPKLCGANRETDELIDLAAGLLGDPAHCEAAGRTAQTAALRTLSFRAMALRLAEFFGALGWTGPAHGV